MIFGQRSVSLALFGAVLLSIGDDTAATRTAAAGRADDRRGRQLIGNVRARKLSKGSSSSSSAEKGANTRTGTTRIDDVTSVESSTTVLVNEPTSEQPTNTPTDAPTFAPVTKTPTGVPSNATDMNAKADESDVSDNDDDTSDFPHPLVIIQENIIDDDKKADVGGLFDMYDADANGVIDKDEFLAIDDATDEQPELPGITKDRDDKPQAPPEDKSKTDEAPTPADKNRVSTFDTGEEFQLESGTVVSCNWPARRRTERRCNEISADGRLVKDICPEACASFIVKSDGENSSEGGGDDEDNANVPTPDYDDGL